MKIRVISVKLEEKVTKTCNIDTPKGVGSYSLFVFKSSGLIKTSIGLSDFNPGDCILIDPTFPHLLMMAAKRRKLLDYLKRTDLKRYQAIIEKLDLRR